MNSNCKDNGFCQWQIFGEGLPASGQGDSPLAATRTYGTDVVGCQAGRRSYVHARYYNGGCFAAPHREAWRDAGLNSLFTTDDVFQTAAMPGSCAKPE